MQSGTHALGCECPRTYWLPIPSHTLIAYSVLKNRNESSFVYRERKEAVFSLCLECVLCCSLSFMLYITLCWLPS